MKKTNCDKKLNPDNLEIFSRYFIFNQFNTFDQLEKVFFFYSIVG